VKPKPKSSSSLLWARRLAGDVHHTSSEAMGGFTKISDTHLLIKGKVSLMPTIFQSVRGTANPLLVLCSRRTCAYALGETM
jgi:hypothetical protein